MTALGVLKVAALVYLGYKLGHYTGSVSAPETATILGPPKDEGIDLVFVDMLPSLDGYHSRFPTP